jgi:predicted enzyme involved in methoxymalonyl-ACP biosynthesis
MEEFMASELLGAAARDEAFEVIGEYVPTAKNSVVKGMYARLGFGQDGEPNYYSFKVRDEAIPECKFIHHGNRSSE